MDTNRSNVDHHDEGQSSPMLTLEQSTSNGLGGVDNIPATTLTTEDSLPAQANSQPTKNASDATLVLNRAGQADSLNVSSECDEADSEELSVMTSLQESIVSHGITVGPSVGQDGIHTLASVIPKLGIGQSASVPDKVPMGKVFHGAVSPKSDTAENQESNRMPPTATSSSAISSSIDINRVPVPWASDDDGSEDDDSEDDDSEDDDGSEDDDDSEDDDTGDNDSEDDDSDDNDSSSDDQSVEDSFRDSTGQTDHKVSDGNKSEDIDERSELLEKAGNEGSEDSHAMYEEIGIDRKYFDHEYFLHYHGLGSVRGVVRRSASGKSYRYVPLYRAYDKDGNKISGQRKTASKKKHQKTAKKPAIENEMAKATEETKKMTTTKATADNSVKQTTTPKNSDVPGKDKANGSITTRGPQEGAVKPKRSKAVGFHEDEEAWFTIFLEKIKGVIDLGSNIEIPSDSMINKLFNGFFEGKVLKDADEKLLSPRVARCRSTTYNHIKRGPVELVVLRSEVLALLGDSTDGQLYVPVITEEEIERYHSDGTIVLDDINDKVKNLAIALSDKEIQKNQQFRRKVNKKRKGDTQFSSYSSAQRASSPEQLKPSYSPLSSTKKASATNYMPTTANHTAKNSSSTNQSTSPPEPKNGCGKPSTPEDVPSSPLLSESPATHAETTSEEDSESSTASESDADNDMEFLDGPLATADFGIDDYDSSSSATEKNASYIERDLLWKQSIDVRRKRQLSEASGHGSEDIAQGEVTDGHEGRPAKKAKVDA